MNKLLLILVLAVAIYFLLPSMNITAQPQNNPNPGLVNAADCYAAMQPMVQAAWPQLSIQDRAIAAWQLINACEP